MDGQELIIVDVFCKNYPIEITIFQELEDFGLIETITQNNIKYISENQITKINKIFRLQEDLNLNNEGIEVVLELLSKIEDLHKEIKYLKTRLNLYE